MSIRFLVSGTKSYINTTRVVGLDDCTTRQVIVDQSYGNPFVYMTEDSSPLNLKFFDCNTRTIISDLGISVTNQPSRVFFDILTSTVIYDDTIGGLVFFNVIDKTKVTVSSYDGIPLSSKIDIFSGAKEIAIADCYNNRIIILDKFTKSILRTISSSLLFYPYRVLCLDDGSFLVRGFNEANLSAIYKFSQNGTLTASFPSFTPFSISGGIISSEQWYSSGRSSSSGISAFAFTDYPGVLIVDESDDSYDVVSLTGNSISGVYVDDSSGDVFVNALQSSSNRIIRVRKGIGVVSSQKSPCQGLIWGLSDFGSGFVAFSNIENAKLSNVSSADISFSAIDNSSKQTELSSSNVSMSSSEFSFKKVGDGSVHVTDRMTNVDVWHFRYTGLSGSKASIDRNLTFESFDVESSKRVPVFCWDFDEDEYVDTFFLSDGKYIRKMAFFYHKEKVYIEKVREISEQNVVSNIFVFDGRFLVSAGGYLSLYSYEDMNRISSEYFASDVVASDYRFGYIWACSKSRGKVWRINQYNLSDFDEFDSYDAPCGLYWSEYFGKYIVHCDNSLKYMDRLSGNIVTFYDVNSYSIDKILVVNNEIAMLLRSHEAIPILPDYTTNEDFQVAVRNRKSDKVCVLSPNKKKYSIEKSLAYNWSTYDVTFDGNTVSFLSSDGLNVYVGTLDKTTGEETTYTYNSNKTPVGIVELPLAGFSVAVLSDWSVIDWSSGNVVPIDSWGSSSSSSSDDYGSVSLLSNGIMINRSEVGKQFGSSSSSCSSSSQSGLVRTYYARIIVGDTPGSANKWDSGEFVTTERCVLYGGGNNLEPGQKYYVSLRCKGDLNVWSPYDVFGFIMPHFDNYTYKSVSSSSSSSNSVETIDEVYSISSGQTVDLGSFDKLAVVFTGIDGESAQIVFGSIAVTIRNHGGHLLFAPGEMYEHEFTIVGETYSVFIGPKFYSLVLVLESDLVFVIRTGF